MPRLNVNIPDQMREWVEERVKSGEYVDATDYVSELIRRDQDTREALVHALIEGEQGGISPRSVRQIIDETKAKLKNGEL